jgi:hypothetical protein
MSDSIEDIYGAGGGSYLKPKDIGADDQPFFWIKRAVRETKTFRPEEGEKQFIVLEFFETPDNPLSAKRWTLNKTQAGKLQDMYGQYTGWAFKGIRVCSESIVFNGERKATIAIYKDKYLMDETTRAQAEQVLQTEQSASAFTGAPQAPAPIPAPQGGGFTPPSSGFTSPATDSDPTKNW